MTDQTDNDIPTAEAAMQMECPHCAMFHFIQAWGHARLAAGKTLPSHQELVGAIGEVAGDAISMHPAHAGEVFACLIEGVKAGAASGGVLIEGKVGIDGPHGPAAVKH